MSFCHGSCPSAGKAGARKFGLRVGQRVRIDDPDDIYFNGWHGHVRTFDDQLVAVDLDEPPQGKEPGGQWFKPSDLKPAPKRRR
ncbi:MAG: hypothetical protein PHI63_06220 [Patescibacteria group bacterium]|nr:hypothetical protein [Patescibacteria group bacterium]